MSDAPENSFSDENLAYRRLFEASPEPMWVYGRETLQFLAVNDAAIRKYGYSRVEFLAMTIQDICPPEDAAVQASNISQVRQGLNQFGVWRHRLADGQPIFVEITSHPLNFEGCAAVVVLVHDVTEKIYEVQAHGEDLAQLQRLNQQLAEREDALKLAQRIGNMGSWQLHIESQTLTWSDHIYAIFKVSPAEFGGTFDDFFVCIHPDDQADFMVEQQAALAGDRPLDITHRIICPSGQIKTVHERAELVNAARGWVLSGTVQDITEQRASQAKIHKNESLLRMAGQLARFGGWSVDLRTQTVEWSAEVCAIHGFSADDPITIDVKQGINFYAPEYRALISRLFYACVEHGIPYDDELQLITAQGDRVWVRCVGEAVRDETGQIIRVQGAFQDISERKQAEQALILSQRRFTQLAEALPHVVWTAEPNGTVDYANRAYYQYRGLAVEAIDLHAQEWTAGLHPDDVDLCLKEWQAAVATDTDFYTEYRIRREDGEYRWHLVTAHPICDEAGNCIKWYGSALDIHDRKLAEAAAQSLASRLNLTLESISDGFFILNRDWQFTFVNREAERLLQRSRSELLGQNIWEAFPDAIDSRAHEAYHQAMATGLSVTFDFYYLPFDAWFDVSAYPSDGGLAVYFQDVTQQRQADEQLRLLESAIVRINDIILITEAQPIDEPGPKIVYVNDAFERRTGYRRDEVIGQTPRLLQGPQTQRQELDRIRTALQNWQPIRSELINYTKSGEPFWLELDIMPITDTAGHYTHWVAVQRDITQRRQVQEQLAQQAALLNETQDAIIVYSLDHIIQFWNQSAERLYGWTAEEALGQSVDALLDKNVNTLAEVTATLQQQDVWHGIMSHRCKDGSRLSVDCTRTLVRDADGQPQAIMAVNTDITQRLALEQQLRQSQRLEAVGQLTGGVAHDFNNLLTVIIGNTELLKEELQRLPTLFALAETTAAAAQRGADLTHRLLAFARRQALDPKVIQVNQLLTEMEPLLRRTLTANIDLKIMLDTPLWWCAVDPSQLESAILNLCLNGRDAMPAGGELTLETANVYLDQDYADHHAEVTPGEYICITTTDSGHGMTPDIIDQVFEPFFTTKESGRGTGLGLSMVYGFIKQSGGHIKLYSELEQGTSVKLYLPRTLDDATTDLSNTDEPLVAGGTETILVVEDDDLVRSHAEMQLQRLGYRVMTAASGSEALQMLYRISDTIDLLFTDVMMPGGMNGPQLARAAQQLYPGLKVLYTSGYTENAVVHRGQIDPGVHLLSKPYRWQDLARLVRQVLSAEDPS